MTYTIGDYLKYIEHWINSDYKMAKFHWEEGNGSGVSFYKISIEDYKTSLYTLHGWSLYNDASRTSKKITNMINTADEMLNIISIWEEELNEPNEN